MAPQPIDLSPTQSTQTIPSQVMPALLPQYPPAHSSNTRSDRHPRDRRVSQEHSGSSQPIPAAVEHRYFRRDSDLSNGTSQPHEGRYHPPPPISDPSLKRPSLNTIGSSSELSPTRATASTLPSNPRRLSGVSPPAVLVREKKQKACANCRKAKLKCIVDAGENDCVRCKARKERCVFYPRSHDEDWQQTLTSDVYNAISHLSSLSRAVHHILESLTSQRIIPPLPGPPLEAYEPASRDLTLLQGWGVERNREQEDRKRKRLDEVEEEIRRRSSASDFQRPADVPRQLSYSWPHSIPTPGPPTVPLPVQSTSVAPRGSFPDYPSVRPEVNGTQPLSVERDLLSLSSYPPPGSYASRPLNPGGAVSPDQPLSQTPISQTTSSPSVIQQVSPAHWMPPPTVPLEEVQTGKDDHENGTGEVADDERVPQLDEDGDEVYGSTDGRMTIITKKIIPAKSAKNLVNYFHGYMAPHMFGYNLQLREFPYLADGPRSITPFILAVECLLASERVPELYKYHGKLADAVLNMLLTSPAESWQTIQGSEESHAVQDQVLGHAMDTEEAWDPELGIGPEEIVAGCALASFISQRNEAKFISLRAFNWAKGWCNYLRAPNTTFVEATGLVPPLRRPSESNMARVWLLSYIVAAQELVQHSVADPSLPTEPSRWCRVLLPDGQSPHNLQANTHDVLLVFHARLASLLVAWLKDRHDMHQYAETEDAAATIAAHRRLASRTNSHLDWWGEDLKSYGLSAGWTAQIHLDWLHAKHLVNSVLSKSIWGTPEDEELRESSRAMAVNCALQLLRRCESWKPPSALTNLPHPYIRMIALAAGEVSEALTEGTWSRVGCPVSVQEVLPILQRVRQLLLQGGMQDGHYCRHTAQLLRQSIDTLQRIASE